MNKRIVIFILVCCGVISTGIAGFARSVLAGGQEGQPETQNKAHVFNCGELSNQLPKDNNCSDCVKDHPLNNDLVVRENEHSPMYVHLDKNHAYHLPPIKAGDNGHLLMVNLVAPGRIISVVQDCHGNVCGWVHPCDGVQCAGHNIPIEYHGDNTAIWWGWSNSGDNAELVFTIHYE